MEPAALADLAEAVGADAETEVGHVRQVLAGDEVGDLADLAFAALARARGVVLLTAYDPTEAGSVTGDVRLEVWRAQAGKEEPGGAAAGPTQRNRVEP